jgi:hypothetical protein
VDFQDELVGQPGMRVHCDVVLRGCSTRNRAAPDVNRARRFLTASTVVYKTWVSVSCPVATATSAAPGREPLLDAARDPLLY